MLRRHCQKLGLTAPDTNDEASLARLSNLAPGDFAAAMRQNRFRPVSSAGKLVQLLHAECGHKGGAKRSIGFVH